jgi:hypothetical protein
MNSTADATASKKLGRFLCNSWGRARIQSDPTATIGPWGDEWWMDRKHFPLCSSPLLSHGGWPTLCFYDLLTTHEAYQCTFIYLRRYVPIILLAYLNDISFKAYYEQHFLFRLIFLIMIINNCFFRFSNLQVLKIYVPTYFL